MNMNMRIDSTLLNGMFINLLTSGDIGDVCPNPVTEQQLIKDLSYSPQTYFDEVGFTHCWTQKLGGIEFLNCCEQPKNSKISTIRIRDSSSKKIVSDVVVGIESRFKSRISLQNQLAEIFQINPTLPEEGKAFLRGSMKIDVDAFNTILEEYPRGEMFKEYFGKLEHPEDIQMFSTVNFLYKFIFEIYEVKFVCGLILPHQYPQKWPFFVILTESQWWNIDNWIEQLEKHINIDFPLRLSEELNEDIFIETLLHRQIIEIQCGLFTLMNTKKVIEDNDSNGSKNASNMEYSGPNSFNLNFATQITSGLTHELVSMFET